MKEVYLKWLNSYQFHGIKPGLIRIKKILKYLGNPHQKIRTIHVAGTNGKGSTCAILSKLLEKQGFKTGLYTSPHLFKLNERFKINGKEINDEELTDCLKILKNVIKDIPTTYFEITTALAFLYFYERRVDIAVIECGLGGRLDATNIIIPEVSIITSIGWDHTKYLGNSLEKIAKEKAGIIKKEKPCVLGNIKKELIPIFEEKTSRLRSELFILGRDFEIKRKEEKWSYKGKYNFSDLELSLRGFYQGNNLACALKTLELLEDKILLKLSEKKIKEALKEVELIGRYQIFAIKEKKFLVDIAHNLDGFLVLKENLLKENFKNFILLLGITNEDREKPFIEMFKILAPLANLIYISEFNSPRKIVNLKEWRKELNKNRIKETKIEYFESPEEALKKTFENSSEKVLITGSAYFVADCLKFLSKYFLSNS